MYENDDRPSLRAEMNAKEKKDMNATFGLSQLTQYYDCNGRCVRVGDWVRFLWWVTCSNGLQRELYYYGRIMKRRGKLVFRYKDSFIRNGGPYTGPKMHERRLDCLNFDSTMDWEIVNEERRNYGVYMPANT